MRISDLFCTVVGNKDFKIYNEIMPSSFLAQHVDHSSETKTGYPHILNIVVCLTS